MLGQSILKKKAIYIGALAGALSVSVVFGIAGYVLTRDLSDFVPGLDGHLSNYTGHNVEVRGAVRVGVTRHGGAWVLLENVVMRPDEKTVDRKTSEEAFYISAETVRLRMALLPLLSKKALVHKDVSAEVLEISGGKFLIEKSASAGTVFASMSANMGGDEFSGWRVSGLETFQVKRSMLGILDQGAEIFTFPVSDFTARAERAGLALALRGSLENQGVVFEGRSGSWKPYLNGERVYVEGTLVSKSVRLAISGSLGEMATHGIEVLARGSADDLRDAAVLAGYGDVERASAMSVSLHAKLTSDAIAIDDIDLKYGRGDLSGWIEARFGSEIEIDGALSSDFLDLQAFEGLRSLHPTQKLFSDSPLPVDFIRRLDGEISFRAGAISLADARLTDGRISVVAKDGVVAVNPIAVTFDEGMLDSSFVLYARDEPGFKVAASAVNFDIGRFLTAAKMTNAFEAKLDFGARLEGRGDTVAAMFAGANGQVNLVMGAGRLGPEIGALFGARASDEDAIDLTCAVSRFDINEGIARSSAMLVQTRDSVTSGKGAFNLRTETIDVRLAPRPRNPAWLDKAADLRVSGSFVEPTMKVMRKNLSRGIAGSLGKFALARHGEETLLPLIDRSVTNNNPCIVTLTGQKGTPEKRPQPYSLTLVR